MVPFGIHLEEKIGIGEGKTQKADAMGHGSGRLVVDMKLSSNRL